MAEIVSVSQINQYIRHMFQRDTFLTQLAVKGEVSNCKYHSSGHIYFTIKDATSQLACVMFAGQRGGLRFRMETGQSVIVIGNISVYERDGKYQLYASEILPEGVGALNAQFERMKQKLEAEGLFQEEHKQPIPRFVRTVGIVTASTGAAIQDIINIATRRNPYVQLVLYPAKVQGEQAAQTIAEGIRVLDKQGLDVLIVGRGGGSIEDLFAFNEECVARAIYEAKTPIISAVGHEVDVTISDYVADLRAPTPSAAAELAIFQYEDVMDRLVDSRQRMHRAMQKRLEDSRNRVALLKKQLEFQSPRYQLQQHRQQLGNINEQMNQQIDWLLQQNRQRLAILAERLHGCSPLARLSGGYSYVADEQGLNVHSVFQTKAGEKLNIQVTDGTIEALVTKVQPAEGE